MNVSRDKYYVPESGWYPFWLSLGLGILVLGIGSFLNAVKAGEDTSLFSFYVGFLLVSFVLFCWFCKVIIENQQGLFNKQVNQSFVISFIWFIFSEIMFFLAFFGVLFYIRFLVLPWLGGEGDKALTGDYLWPDFVATWPLLVNPSPDFVGPRESLQAPHILQWFSYLPFWNTVILITSSVTVHFAHVAVKLKKNEQATIWLGVTVALGVIFLILQVIEYLHAYNDLGLTLDSGIYGSTFFLLTGFHGLHVFLGTFMLFIQFIRSAIGHFSPDNHFGLEASSWYWHFVDVVWICLFFLVYVF